MGELLRRAAFRVFALRLRALVTLLLALERRRIAHPKGLGLRRFSKSITSGICGRWNGVQGSVCTAAAKKFSRCGYISEVGRTARSSRLEPPSRRRPRAVATPRGIVCSPPRYRLSVSTLGCKGCASLLKARHGMKKQATCECGAVYERTEERLTFRDSDHFVCCGETLARF
jgi:hypothetical protein